MRIVVSGGGSGGHITPLLAVAHELKLQQTSVEIIYIGQKGDSLADIPAQDKNIDQVYVVRAGKFRRYHGEGIRQFLHVPTVLRNIRDMFFVLAGCWQSFWLLKRLRPEIVFVKGGFVGVPVGLAAAVLRIPYITHDSDALPGLANRIIAPWARLHAVALPKEVYTYAPEKTVVVGVPVSHQVRPFSRAEMQKARAQIGLPPTGKMLLVTGGGLGAQRINDAVVVCMQELLDRYKDLWVVHVAGRALETDVRKQYQAVLPSKYQKRVLVKGYLTNLYLYSGVADVIITRAGATAIAEFAAQHKACIVVPNPLLTGGHQLKNAKVLSDRAAVRLVSEEKIRQDDHALMSPLIDLFDYPTRAADLGERLALLTQPDSAKRLAMLLLKEATH